MEQSKGGGLEELLPEDMGWNGETLGSLGEAVVSRADSGKSLRADVTSSLQLADSSTLRQLSRRIAQSGPASELLGEGNSFPAGALLPCGDGARPPAPHAPLCRSPHCSLRP